GSEDQRNVVHLEHPGVLLGEGVLRLGEDPHQGLVIEVFHGRHHGEAPDELGDESVLHEVLGEDLAQQLRRPAVGLGSDLGAKTHSPLPDAGRDDVLEAPEGPATDEEDVRGVELDEFLVRVLAPTLRRDGGHGSLEDLEEGLLHAFTRHVPGYRRVLRLAGHLVDLVDVDDPLLGPVDVVIGGLEQLQQDVLDVLTHVARLGETGGVGDGEGHVELAGQGLGEEGLAAAGRADEEDVRLLKLDVPVQLTGDRKSTRLNSSHVKISYAVFCLKKKNTYY